MRSITFCVILLAGVSCGARPLGDAAPAQPVTTADFYYHEGRRIALDRSATDLVALFRPGAAPDAVLSAVAPAASLGQPLPNGGNTYHVISMSSADEGALAGLAAALRRRDEVLFVSPVFRNPQTGTRLIPTEEVIVKLGPGLDRAGLEKAAARHRMSVGRALAGTSDEFVLRAVDPRQQDPVERSRALHDSGLFEWAEPNFIQRYQESRNGR